MASGGINIENCSDATHEEAFLGMRAVLKRTSLSRAQIYVEMSEKRFPKPYPITAGRKAWLKSDVDNWIAEKISKSSKDAD